MSMDSKSAYEMYQSSIKKFQRWVQETGDDMYAEVFGTFFWILWRYKYVFLILLTLALLDHYFL